MAVLVVLVLVLLILMVVLAMPDFLVLVEQEEAVPNTGERAAVVEVVVGEMVAQAVLAIVAEQTEVLVHTVVAVEGVLVETIIVVANGGSGLVKVWW